MGLFIAGFVTGIMGCILTMLIRCAVWYERKHPEDDYWHMRIWHNGTNTQDPPDAEGENRDDEKID